MTSATRPRTVAAAPWRDVRVLQWVFQIVVLAVIVSVVAVLVGNVRENSRSLGIPTGYGYLDNPASFPIPDSDFRQRQPVRDALVIGLVNTLRVSIVGIVLSTVLGTLIGVARLSRNWLLRNAARVYVEVIRNLPLLLILMFCYAGLALVAFPRIAERVGARRSRRHLQPRRRAAVVRRRPAGCWRCSWLAIVAAVITHHCAVGLRTARGRRPAAAYGRSVPSSSWPPRSAGWSSASARPCPSGRATL